MNLRKSRRRLLLSSNFEAEPLFLWDYNTMTALSDIPVSYTTGGETKVYVDDDQYGNYIGAGKYFLAFETGYTVGNDYYTENKRSSYIIFKGIDFSKYKTLEIRKVDVGYGTHKGPTCGYSSNTRIPAHGSEGSPSGWDDYQTFGYWQTGGAKQTITFDISSVKGTKNIIIIAHTASAAIEDGIYYICLS